MSKFGKSILRKDTMQDHCHEMPDGKLSMGVQYKPNANHRAGWHTHLYEHDGDVYETDAAYEGGDHVHDAHEFKDLPGGGLTAKPQPAPKHRGVELSRDA